MSVPRTPPITNEKEALHTCLERQRRNGGGGRCSAFAAIV